MATSSDHNVTETALDAVKCKLSAVTLGYFEDEFLTHFVSKPTRRIPLIHRGYYLRHIAIEDCVQKFLDAHRDLSDAPLQILSLGAGFDTLFFRILKQRQNELNLRFIEIDCEAIAVNKGQILQTTIDGMVPPSSKVIVSAASQSSVFECSVAGNNGRASYALLESDLGDIKRLQSLFVANSVEFNAPTLILAECVLSYLDPSAGTELMRWLATSFSDAAAVIYDPLALNDAFGATLRQYFAVKGCELLSQRAYQLPSDHARRLLHECTWQSLRIVDMNGVFAGCTTQAEKKRLQQLEPFDEYADWIQCNAHYGIFLATTQPVSNTHWSAQFCATRGFSAQRIQAPTDSLASSLIVRSFQSSDLKQVQQLFQSTHLEYACKAVKKFVANRIRAGDLANVNASFLQSHRSHFWVVESAPDDGKERSIVGCIGLKPREGNSAELCRLSVTKSHRRRGIAAKLVTLLEEFAVLCGYESIHLDTIESMAAAQAFYAARGYVESPVREKFSTFTLVNFTKML